MTHTNQQPHASLPHTKSPRVVIDRKLGKQALSLEDHFRKLGWSVKIAEDPTNARKLAQRATAVVLPAEGVSESGFLTCAKMRKATPEAHVVLVGPDSDDYLRFSRFVGATAYATAATPIAAIAAAIVGAVADPRLNRRD